RMQYLWRTLKIHIRNREWNNVLLTKTVLCIIPLCTKSTCSAYNLIKTFTQLNPSLLENLLHQFSYEYFTVLLNTRLIIDAINYCSSNLSISTRTLFTCVPIISWTLWASNLTTP